MRSAARSISSALLTSAGTARALPSARPSSVARASSFSWPPAPSREERLVDAVGPPGVGDDLGGERSHRRVELVVGHAAVDQADLGRGGGADAPAGEHELLGPGAPDALGETDRHAPRRNQAPL